MGIRGLSASAWLFESSTELSSQKLASGAMDVAVPSVAALSFMQRTDHRV